jgi:hypothetical protein
MSLACKVQAPSRVVEDLNEQKTHFAAVFAVKLSTASIVPSLRFSGGHSSESPGA